MAPVAGKPFVEWVVRYLAKQGIRNTILSTGHLAHRVAEHFQTCPVPGVRIHCIAESAPLGTAGGFLNAVRSDGRTPAAWLVLNGDSLVFAEIASMTRSLSGSGAEGVILGLTVTDTSRYGSLVKSAEGDLTGFSEKKPGAGVISAGVYLLRHSLLDHFPNISPLSFEQDVFPSFLVQGLVLKVVEGNAPFLDIGTEESFSKAEEFIRQNLVNFYV